MLLCVVIVGRVAYLCCGAMCVELMACNVYNSFHWYISFQYQLHHKRQVGIRWVIKNGSSHLIHFNNTCMDAIDSSKAPIHSEYVVKFVAFYIVQCVFQTNDVVNSNIYRITSH